ncbi:MAG: Pirin domain protein [Fluviicola sp.]|jgi:redox-sensitive bicupin YhaK (pirin superfamily)|uniref:pirin family protein n=1 Tax=Fluviicola sp. TaxID=1917219 RepID=UPI00262450D7|nr:pirin family protein [Fluviicola sp.]MDF3026912.1 Pirin domain protein [Fluviicola sp.]
MKTIFHSENSRGHANHGWLNAKHSFSFASWYNPDRVHFGTLRVLNDDTVSPGMGFGTHPHDNMEIITIPLEGAIAHKDSMGNSATINAGEIQVMSAGTGVQHSEFNPNEDQDLKLFQIWLFPNKRNVEPRYDQQKIAVNEHPNEFVQILSPDKDDAGVWIHQDAWFHMGKFTEDKTLTYEFKNPANGLYVMQIEGSSVIDGQQLNRRDALGIMDTSSVTLHITKDSTLLLMEVPMEVKL